MSNYCIAKIPLTLHFLGPVQGHSFLSFVAEYAPDLEIVGWNVIPRRTPLVEDLVPTLSFPGD